MLPRILKQLILLLCLSFLPLSSGHAAFLGGNSAVQSPGRTVMPIMQTPPFDNLSSHPAKNGTRYREGEILVKFRPALSDAGRSALHGKHGSKRLKEFKKLNLHQVQLKKGLSVEAALKLYRTDPGVEFVEPNYLVSAAATPNDPFYASSGSWGQPYQDLWGLHKMQLASAWETTKGSAQVVVAVSDTGLDLSHPDIQANIWSDPVEILNGIDDDGNGYVDDVNGWNFITGSNDFADDHGHGTHVSGTIAAGTDNGVGMAGVSWYTRIMPLKFLDANGQGSVGDGIASILYAADNGAQVVNCSWGFTSYSQSLKEAIEYAFQKGVVVVAAAGNGSMEAAEFYPGGYGNVLTVAATDNLDQKASFTNFGAAVDVSAPGVDILSLRAGTTDMYLDGGTHVVDTRYFRASGTSMAAPHVSGLAALLFAENPTWTGKQVMAQIVATADGLADAGLGSGRVNAPAALTAPPTRQRLQYEGLTIVPESGADDGYLRAGQSYLITASVRSIGAPTYAVVELATFDNFVIVADYAAPLNDLPAWEVVSNASHPFRIEVSPNAPKLHRVDFTLAILGPDGSRTTVSFDKRISPHASGWPVAVGEDSFSDPTLTDLDGDGVPEVVMHSDQIYVLKGDGTPLPGWPRPSPGLHSEGIAAGDLDGDGRPELVGNSMDAVYAWKADGTMLPGFPLDLSSIAQGGAGFLNLALGDLDGDGRLEIVCSANWAGKVYAWRGDGSVLPGWPTTVTPANSLTNYMFPAIGDLDGDGTHEVLVPTADKLVHAWHGDGSPVTGWPVALPEQPDAVVIGDLQGNGESKIFVGAADSRVYAFNSDGSPLPGWPQAGAAPALGDLDGDGMLEIVTDGVSLISAYRGNGTQLPGWPRAKLSNTLKSPLLADIDGDGGVEVVERTLWGIYAWHADGTPIANFPVQIASDDMALPDASLAIGDIKGNGKPYLVTGSGSGDRSIHVFEVPGSVAPLRLTWPMQQRDAQRSGRSSRAPVIVTSRFAAVPGLPYQLALAAREGLAPYSWTVAAGALPAGLTLDASGTISGTPLAPGSSGFTLRVRDAAGVAALRAFTFTVAAVVIETVELPAAHTGIAYSQTLSVAGGVAPYAWSVAGGALPPGLSLDPATGVIAGWASAGGNFAFSVRVADSDGKEASQGLQLTVWDPQPVLDGRMGSAEAITVDKRGNVYTVTDLHEQQEKVLVKSSAAGAEIWNRSFVCNVVIDVLVDDNDNVFVAGHGDSEARSVAIKYDAAGNPLWTRYDDGSLYGAALDATGNLYLAGTPYLRSGADAWLSKYDPAGTLLWKRTDLSAATPAAVAAGPAGSAYVYFDGQSVVKVDSLGGTLWSRLYSESGFLGVGMAVDQDDNLTLASQGDLAKYSPSGELLWRVWDASTTPFDMVSDREGNSYLTGHRHQGNPLDLYLSRYDASGNLIWSKTVDRGYDEIGFSVAVSEEGDSVYVAGGSTVFGYSYPLTARFAQPKVAAGALPQATANENFSHPLAARGGTSPYAWSQLSGTLPQGLSLDPQTGVISGTPFAAGSYSFTVKAAGGNGLADARTFNLSVAEALPVTDFVASTLSGQAPLVVNFTDASTNSPSLWSWSFGDGASGSAQHLSHTYSVPGTYTVSLTTTGAAGVETRTRTDYITVLACSNAPVGLASLASGYFSDPAAAYAQALDNDLIMLQALDFGTGLYLDRNIKVTLKGGYDCGYLDNKGSAGLSGALRVVDGTLQVERVVLR